MLSLKKASFPKVLLEIVYQYKKTICILAFFSNLVRLAYVLGKILESSCYFKVIFKVMC